MLTLAHDRRGQTLLEVIAAIAVLGIGAVTLTALTVQSLSLARTVRERVAALNLAREGVEWARSVRDSNWLRNDVNVPWNTGLSNGTDYSAVIGWNESTRAFDVNWTPDLSALGASNQFARLYLTADGAYTTNIVGTTKTIFDRVVMTNAICWNLTLDLQHQVTSETIATDHSPCPGGTSEVGVDVHSYVRYTDVRTYTVQLEERLYNWREGAVDAP